MCFAWKMCPVSTRGGFQFYPPNVAQTKLKRKKEIDILAYKQSVDVRDGLA